MADNGTDFNLFKFHVKEEYSPTNVKVEEVDEQIIKTETEVSGGEQTVNINEKWNLENSEEQLLNENSGIRKDAFDDDSNILGRINNLSTNREKDDENGSDFDNGNTDCDGEEKVSQQDLIENMNINNKEKNKFLHNDNDYLSTGSLKKRVLVSQEQCENDFLNHRKGKNQKSEDNNCNATEIEYKCNECSYAAERKRNLLYHIKYHHTMEKPFNCNECSYSTVHRSNLLSHTKSRHTTEKSHKCNECSYAAVQKHTLLHHIKSHHTMEKPFKCNECSYATVRKCDLLRHTQSHHLMEKPYRCNECSYTTVKKCYLLSHIQSYHTMEKPYKCNECSYATICKQQLLRHIKSRHTMEKPYKCNECSYAAARKEQLLRHIESHHSMEKP